MSREIRPTLIYEDQQLASIKANPDINVRVFSGRGRFIKAIAGDYNHLEFVDSKGKPLSFYASDDRITYFCLAHKNQTVDIHYETLDRWIPHADGYDSLARLISIQTDTLDFYTWWKAECKSLSVRGAEQKYEKLFMHELYGD